MPSSPALPRLTFPLLAVLVTVVALGAFPARAGTVLKWHETRHEDGKKVQTASIATSGPLGLRVEMTDIGVGTSGHTTFLYLASTRTLYMKQAAAQEWVTITAPLVESLRKRAITHIPEKKELPVTVSSLGTRHTYGGFACESWILRQKERPSRIVCLADPASIQIDETVRKQFQEMSRLMIGFMAAAEAASGLPASTDEGIRYNTYDMPQGFPVKVWESRAGQTWMDTELVSVSAADPPADLFEPPAPPQAAVKGK